LKNSIDQYSTIVFDCDGVLLDSNRIKSEAFYKTSVCYGEEIAQLLVDYNAKNGGISRIKKFEYLLNNLIKPGQKGPNLEQLLDSFAEQMKTALLSCKVASGINKLRKKTITSKWMIVSGGMQKELKSVFNSLGMINLFDGGIFGSPETKLNILKREVNNGNIKFPALYIGDSKYDYIVSKSVGLDFVFLTDWTEFKDWKSFFDKKTKVFRNLYQLCINETMNL